MHAQSDETSGDAPVLVYDGDCQFCTRAISMAERSFPTWPRAVDGRRENLDPLALDRDDAARSAWLVVPSDDGVRHYEGADALGEVLRHQPSPPHRFAGHLLAIPPIGFAAQAGYRVIAANRHRLHARHATDVRAEVPTPLAV